MDLSWVDREMEQELNDVTFEVSHSFAAASSGPSTSLNVPPPQPSAPPIDSRYDLNVGVEDSRAEDLALDAEFERIFNETVKLPSFIDQSVVTAPPVDAATPPPRHAQEDNVRRPAVTLDSTAKRPIPLPDIEITADNYVSFLENTAQPSPSARKPRKVIPMPSVSPHLELDDECEYERSFRKSMGSNDSLGSPGHKPLFIDAKMVDSSFASVGNERSYHSEHRSVRKESVMRDSPQLLRRDSPVRPKAATRSPFPPPRMSPRINPDTTSLSFERDNGDLERMRMQNTISSLESRVAVLERRLEYSNFVSKMSEEERDRALDRVKSMRAELEDERHKNRQHIMSARMQPVVNSRGTSPLKRGPVMDSRGTSPIKVMNEKADNEFATSSGLFERASPSGKDRFRHSTGTGMQYHDERSRATLKEELKRRLLEQARSQRYDDRRGRQIVKNDLREKERTSMPVYDDEVEEDVNYRSVNVQTDGPLPFVVGKALPSFSLPANIQQVRAILKNNVPVANYRSKSREKSRSRDRSKSHDLSHLSYQDSQSLLRQLEADYSEINRQYDAVLHSYKRSPQTFDFQPERERLASQLRVLIRQMERTMGEISKLRHYISRKGPVASGSAINLSPNRASPSRAFSSLCALKGAQRMQEQLISEANETYAMAYGGINR